jgi:hypothetical protein
MPVQTDLDGHMRQTIQHVTAMARQRFGEGELYISERGNVFWRHVDGHDIPLGYTVLDAQNWLVTLSGPWRRSFGAAEEEE